MRRKSTEPAPYLKQLMRYGEFCKSMLTDPYEEIKREKFWSKKNLLRHVIQHRFQKPYWLFFKVMPCIRNAFFHPFGPLLWDRALRNWPTWESWKTCGSRWWLAALLWTADPVEPIWALGKASSRKGPIQTVWRVMHESDTIRFKDSITFLVVCRLD